MGLGVRVGVGVEGLLCAPSVDFCQNFQPQQQRGALNLLSSVSTKPNGLRRTQSLDCLSPFLSSGLRSMLYAIESHI